MNDKENGHFQRLEAEQVRNPPQQAQNLLPIGLRKEANSIFNSKDRRNVIQFFDSFMNFEKALEEVYSEHYEKCPEKYIPFLMLKRNLDKRKQLGQNNSISNSSSWEDLPEEVRKKEKLIMRELDKVFPLSVIKRVESEVGSHVQLETENEQLRKIKVSPDGRKVIILHKTPTTAVENTNLNTSKEANFFINEDLENVLENTGLFETAEKVIEEVKFTDFPEINMNRRRYVHVGRIIKVSAVAHCESKTHEDFLDDILDLENNIPYKKSDTSPAVKVMPITNGDFETCMLFQEQ